MSTRRSDSIARSRHEDPFDAAPSRDGNPEDLRTIHYAALARVMYETMRQFVTNEDTALELNQSRSAKSLRWNYVDSLTTQAHTVLHSEAFVGIHQKLQKSQSERSPGFWQLIEENIEAGVHTFANTTESVYDAIAEEFSPEIADSHDNFVIIDRLAKLGINQFASYRGVYLDTVANRKQFASHLRPHKTGVGYKPGYPHNAKVPTVLAKTQDLHGADDFLLDDTPLIRIADFPDSDKVIGCPITFYSDHVKELWRLYADGRRSLRHRAVVGLGSVRATNSGDIAASHEAIQ